MAEAQKVTVKKEKTVVVEEPCIRVTLSIDEASALLAVLGRCSADVTYRAYSAINDALGDDCKPYTVKHYEDRFCGTIYVREGVDND